MIDNRRIGVVVPAYNEEKLIGRVIETMPFYVDRILVIDDCSRDRTVEVVRSYVKSSPDRVTLVQHDQNRGVGGAILTGYKAALKEEIDVTVVMAGDAQMDPNDLDRLIALVVKGEVDYSKGNRLFRGESWEMIPHYRYLGNSVLSLLTKIASGYWHVADSQCGYTAISKTALARLNLDRIYTRYGFPNDLLIDLNIHNFRVADISVRPVYNIGEKSGIRLRKVIPTISWLLFKGFFRRMGMKYIIKDFHPLVFFYSLGLILLPIGLIMGLYLLIYRLTTGPVAMTSALFSTFLTISGLQSLFFGMWFDMDYNKRLR